MNKLIIILDETMEETYKSIIENQFKAFNNMLEGVSIYKLIFNDKNEVIDAVLQYMNPATVETMGLNPEEAVGKKATHLFDSDYLDPIFRSINQFLNTGKFKGFEIYYPPKDKYFLISGFNMVDGYFAVVRTDITSQKHIEQNLEDALNNLEERAKERAYELDRTYKLLNEGEEKYKQFFEASPNFTVHISLNGKIIDANKAALEILGKSKDELIGTNFTQIDMIFKEDVLLHFKNFLKLLAGKHVDHYETRIRKKDGEVRWGDTYPILLRKNKIPNSLLVISHDITDRKRAEEQLKETVRKLEHSNNELQSFTYITSHDLQEPLRTMGSYAGLLKRRYHGKFDKDADEFLDFMISGSERMKEQIQGLLEYSRVGTQGGEFKKFNAEDAFDAALSKLRSSIDECHAQVTHDPLPDIVADESQISSIFQNLILNALKFKKDGIDPKIHISAKKENNEYIFSVKDNGIGIEKQYTDTIFEMFKRLHPIGKYEGAGIGLAIVKRIIDRHQGRIWVKSKYGKGSTFYFTIPVEPVKIEYENS